MPVFPTNCGLIRGIALRESRVETQICCTSITQLCAGIVLSCPTIKRNCFSRLSECFQRPVGYVSALLVPRSVTRHRGIVRFSGALVFWSVPLSPSPAGTLVSGVLLHQAAFVSAPCQTPYTSSPPPHPSVRPTMLASTCRATLIKAFPSSVRVGLSPRVPRCVQGNSAIRVCCRARCLLIAAVLVPSELHRFVFSPLQFHATFSSSCDDTEIIEETDGHPSRSALDLARALASALERVSRLRVERRVERRGFGVVLLMWCCFCHFVLVRVMTQSLFLLLRLFLFSRPTCPLYRASQALTFLFSTHLRSLVLRTWSILQSLRC